MRLLSALTYRLEEFFEPLIPAYAILSHRWEDDEVLFSDVQSNQYELKKGFQKIQSACGQAVHDGLEYLWIDTCAIDKKSSAELSEAINSMYRWYQDASVCYAFISDLRDGSDAFAASVWFKRGWTLQELIAPRRVVFYGPGWTCLGTRDGMKTLLSEITGISVDLLADDQRPPLSRFSIAQRMSWAALRETTRIEDRAYSLLGLFSVNMPLLYGEGERAFIRLQEEIIKHGTDLSIFAWDFKSFAQDFYSKRLFATSPDDFVDCGDVLLSRKANDPTSGETILTMTNVGLRIENPLISYPELSSSNGLALSLECRSSDVTTVLALQLEPAQTLMLESQGQQSSMEKFGTVCYPGWSDDSSEEVSSFYRITHVDLDKPHISPVWRVITIPRNIDAVHRANAISDSFAHTHVWIKLLKDTRYPWEIDQVYPNKFWNEDNSTFDLQSADIGRHEVRWCHGAVVISHDLHGQYVIFFALGRRRYPQNEVRVKIMKFRPMMLLNSVNRLTESDEMQMSEIGKTPSTEISLPSGERLVTTVRAIQRSGISIVVLETGVPTASHSSSQMEL